MKDILILFGGISPEHEVSIITGLQVVESIDKERYNPHVIYVTKKGEFKYLWGVTKREEFLSAEKYNLTFGRNEDGGFISVEGKLTHPYAAYVAFHGGLGESGPMQGFLETLGIPYSSSSVEGAVLTMNKGITKEMVTKAGVPVVPSVVVTSEDIRKDSEKIVKSLIEKLSLPLIVKPVHLGSSIGIAVAKTEIALEKALLQAAFVDSEIVIEKFISQFQEFNCSVRLINGVLETSEIEMPFSKDEILSFADKYQRGGMKSGGSGMASLQRELPAKIPFELKQRIEEYAKAAFLACRCKGMVRIDFMYTGSDLYLTEINPIPGSMAFYLWEATGYSFTEQITDLLEQAVRDYKEANGRNLVYESSIVEKFVEQQ